VVVGRLGASSGIMRAGLPHASGNNVRSLFATHRDTSSRLAVREEGARRESAIRGLVDADREIVVWSRVPFTASAGRQIQSRLGLKSTTGRSGHTA
jgi:hypothetical protein